MFSLDVVVWKGKRSEQEAVMKKAKQQQRGAAMGQSLPRVVQDKKIKQIYGKTTQEMYEAYLHRVDHWMQDAPTQDWTKTYDKETYSRAYLPRERHKDKDLGGPVVKIGYAPYNHARLVSVLDTVRYTKVLIVYMHASSGCLRRSYSPRAVYKGGGKCVRHIVDPKAVDESSELPRELYKQRIANFEKTREKHKELHPPMMIPKNKPLSCGKFFVQDVICCSHSSNNNSSSNQHQNGSMNMGGCRKCAARCPSPSKEEHEPDDRWSGDRDDVTKKPFYRHIHSRVGHGDDKESKPTAEYVASPQWRVHNPQKWIHRDFTTTIASTDAHTATVTSISGKPYKPSLLIAEKFATTNRHVLTPTSPVVRAFEHERRVKTAATALNVQRSPQRVQKKYFNSMWTELVAGNETGTAAIPPLSPPIDLLKSPASSSRLGGRDLVLNLREQAKILTKSPPKSPPRTPSNARKAPPATEQ